MRREYTGDCYIGVVGPEAEFGTARDSIEAISRRHGDTGPRYVRATKGFEARQTHVNNFIESKHDFILLLDHDMIFEPDTLEKLRGHKLPYVTGYYMRRRFNPIAPVWFEYNPEQEWPHRPFTDTPQPGKLVRLGASGWGCILIHREVILAVREILKGEPEVIEDDMDIWPYDLPRVLKTIKRLSALPTAWNMGEKELRQYVEAAARILREEIRPLRGQKDNVGSDLRFPFFARAAGYDLWGDPAVRPGHVLYYPLSPDDYDGVPEEHRKEMVTEPIKRKCAEARQEWRQHVAQLRY